ncbi:hypothetical protein FACS1894201_03620 [Bacteroidia bacterium]|nr:hypothetical protein FACS1894201_03620 [Bacteroidia bacterium]
MKQIGLLYGIMFFASVAFAQLDRPLRVEISIPENTYPFEIVNLKEQGLLVHTANAQAHKTMTATSQYYYLYDSFLIRKWQTKTTLPENYDIAGYSIIKDTLLMVAGNRNYNNRLAPNYLLKWSLTDGKMTIDTLHTISKVSVVKAFISEQHLWLVHSDRTELQVTLSNRQDTGVASYEFAKFSGNELLDIAFDTVAQQLYIAYTDDNRRDDKIMVAVADLQLQVRTMELSMNKTERPVSIQIMIPKHKPPVFFGTYNTTRDRQTFSNYDRYSESIGFFTAKEVDQTLQISSKINYAEFADIETSISIDGLRVLQHSKSKRDTQLVMSNLIRFNNYQNDQGFLLVGESFARDLTTKTESYYDYYGRVVPYTTTVFDSYRYMDAYIWTLDEHLQSQGSAIVDVSLSQKNKTMLPNVAAYPNGEHSAIAFMNAVNLFFCADNKKHNLQTLRLNSLYKADRIVDAELCSAQHWYNNALFISGYQTIQNNTLKDESKRRVFMITKLVIENDR